MAYTAINKSTDYFNNKTWTGTGSSNALTGLGHQTDFAWIKQRSGTTDHHLYDVLRGVTKALASNATDTETTKSTGLTAFGSDGFTLGADGGVNGSSNTYVGWSWKAGGTGSANTNGSINSTVSVNTTAGFSIVKFVGNSTSGATVGHGLGVAPKLVIIKSRDTAYSWRSYHASLGATKYIELDASSASATASNFMNNTAPTNSVFYLGNGDTPNKNGDNYIAYCFAEKVGYSKIGKYIGNGNANGTFVYTGFAPKFVLLKRDGADGWWLVDDKQANPYPNPNVRMLVANTTGADNTSVSPFIDIYSNGFKLRSTWAGVNDNGANYIYYAIGQSLVGSNNVPCTAR